MEQDSDTIEGRLEADAAATGALREADLGQEHLEQLVDEHVSATFVARAEEAADRARVVAYLAIELARDYQRLTTTLGVLVDAERHDNSGDLLNALHPLVGLDVVLDVLQGLRVVTSGSLDHTWASDLDFRRCQDHAWAYVDAVGERAALAARDGGGA